MKASLSPSWELSTDHAASTFGSPVLVDRDTGETYGPADSVQPYPGKGYMRVTLAVGRLAEAADLDEQPRALVARIVALLPSP